jgi:hypothetical protein
MVAPFAFVPYTPYKSKQRERLQAIAANAVILSEAKNLATLGRKAIFFVGAEAPPQNDTHELRFYRD